MSKQPMLADVLNPFSSEEDEVGKNKASGYEALTPRILEYEESAVYTQALNFACSRQDVRNIAVTGAYGAGKSSVLRTWKECPDNDLRVMTVSLADFEMQSPSLLKAEPETKDATINTANEKKAAAEEKTIEYSILQQLLYKEKKSALPYSRIERIADITAVQVAAIAGNLFLIISITLAGLFCLFPDYARKKMLLPDELSQYLIDVPAFRLGVSGILLFAALYLAVKKLHRIGIFDRRVSVDKIDILKGAISARPSAPSLLNVYIDEIVYFFEETGYNVVVFEDLDRHNDGAIFIKLREINQIINNTRPDGEPVRFIYAVRDGLFSTAEARTKFFDFVIPVIPVMDSENAAEHFISMFRKDELEAEGFSKCVTRLSMFIPDMRIMTNIANEFRIYQNLVNGADDIKRLLSIIAYKNICAEDYHGVDEKKGVLYSFVKAFVSGELQEEVNNKRLDRIKLYENEIGLLVRNEAENIEEIRLSILSKYIPLALKETLSFNIPGEKILSLDAIAKDEVFFAKLLDSDSFQIRYSFRNLDILVLHKDSIDQIKHEYMIQSEELSKKNAGRIEDLKYEIEGLRWRINSLQYVSLSDMARVIGSTGFAEWVNEKLTPESSICLPYKNSDSQMDFIYFLLINEYIATDYMFYRSVFRPGSLSHEDNEFIKAVSVGKPQEQTLVMPLMQTENVVTKLEALGLIMESRAWHPDVLLFLLRHDIYRLRSITKFQLHDRDKENIMHLHTKIFSKWAVDDRIKYVRQMTFDLQMTYAFLERLYSMSNKLIASQLVILQLSSTDLVCDNTSNRMKEMVKEILSTNGLFPDMIYKKHYQKFKENFLKVGIYISNLEECSTRHGRSIVRVIAEHQRWIFTLANLRVILKTLGNSVGINNDYIKKEPLSAIYKLDIPGVTMDVWQNINQFVNEAFVNSQDLTHIPDLLKSKELFAETKLNIITKMQFQTDCASYSSIEGGGGDSEASDIISLLLMNNRIRTEWPELKGLLNDNVVSNNILAKWFEENHAVFDDTELSFDSFLVIDKLIKNLFNSAELSDGARRKILLNLHLMFLFLPDNLTLGQATLLIENRRLAPSAEVFEQLYKMFNEEGDLLTPLLSNLVLQNHSLLQTDPQLVLIKDGEFYLSLAEQLLTDEYIPESIRISALNWLWGFDPALFSQLTFISSQAFIRLAAGLMNNNMRHAVLVHYLNEEDIRHEDIEQLLRSFTDDAYLAFTDDKEYRRISYTDELWELARLLESAGFIRSLKWDEKYKRIRFIPHHNPGLMQK